MDHEEQYERWKQSRAQVDVPDDFADRVMTSIHQTRQRAWWSVLYRVALAVGRSRIARAAAASLAVAVCLLRIGSALAIFIPR
jgi:hypothetical protein